MGSIAGQRCVRWKRVRTSTGGYARRCAEFSGTGALGGLESFGQIKTLRGTLASVKGVLITGSIAAGGAIVTEKVFDTISKQVELHGYAKELAKMATGVFLGIIIGKVLKKPQIAAAFAIGPVVAGVINIIHNLLGEPPAEWEVPATEGYGMDMVAIEPYRSYEYAGVDQNVPAAINAPEGLGAVQVGQGVPSWMYGQVGNQAGAYPFPPE